MSILIKGMEMPKSCIECPFIENGNLFSYICGIIPDSDFEFIEDRRRDFCPLVEIPTPHGRLIDADAFFEDICNDINVMTKIGIAVDGDWLWEKLDDALGHAPTLIESEE